ncbi:hypothetical protein B4Q13_15855, partial [Lacticaseibacillus rhamnosus]
HNHPMYNIFQRWTPKTKFKNRYEWRDLQEYKDLVGTPGAELQHKDDQTFCDIDEYVEVKELIGGTTSVAGISGRGANNNPGAGLPGGAGARLGQSQVDRPGCPGGLGCGGPGGLAVVLAGLVRPLGHPSGPGSVARLAVEKLALLAAAAALNAVSVRNAQLFAVIQVDFRMRHGRLAAAQLRPDDAAIYKHLSQALGRLGRSKEAEQATRQALQLRPDDADRLAQNDRGLCPGFEFEGRRHLGV